MIEAKLSGDALRYAQAVARAGSFGAAARAHGVSQPALSKSIAKLEENLRDRLFERHAGGAKLTAFGTRMMPHIENAVASLNKIVAEASSWSGAANDVSRLGVSPLISRRLISGLFDTAADYPALGEWVVREANLSELRTALEAGEFDLIVVASVERMPRFESHIVHSEPVVLVDSKDPSREIIQVEELAGRQFILPTDDCELAAFTIDLMKQHELPLQVYPGKAFSCRALEDWAKLGLGSALLPISKIADASLRSRVVMEGDLPVEIFYAVLWDPLSPRASELKGLVEQYTRSQRSTLTV